MLAACGFRDSEITEIISSINKLSLKIAGTLEKYITPIGEIGLDFIIDTTGRVWFLEANSKPGRRAFSQMELNKDERLSIIRPMLYARYLAGFREGVGMTTKTTPRIDINGSQQVNTVEDNVGTPAANYASPKKKNNDKNPVIGILTTNKLHSGRIKPTGVQGELSFLSRMGRRVPAKVYVFHPWDIDWKNNKFTGYRFLIEEDGYGRWVKGPVPPPDVVYDQIYTRIAERRYLQDRTRLNKLTKGRYFNPCYLNKHVVHNYLKDIPEIRPHLPKAKVLKEPDDLTSMLTSFPNLYLKPVTGSLGRGIVRITRESGRFVLKGRGGRVRYALSIKDVYRKFRALYGLALPYTTGHQPDYP